MITQQNLDDVQAEGAQALQWNEGKSDDDPSFITADRCPYQNDELRAAWLKGFQP